MLCAMAEGNSMSIYEAKTHFSRLVARAEAGEETVVTRHGRPVARIAPLQEPPRKRIFGLWKGRFEVPDDFNDPMTEEELSLWYDGPVFPPEEE
jgi:prevent-host-death family protein